MIDNDADARFLLQKLENFDYIDQPLFDKEEIDYLMVLIEEDLLRNG